MTVLDVIQSPWAIAPGKLQEICAIYAARVQGDGVDLEAAAQRLGRPLDNQQKTYDVVDGVAIVTLEGVMGKRMNMFSAISGGASTQLVARELLAADADNTAHSIILLCDTPGGTVDGTQILADVYAGLSKPTATLASGSMCSAGYWVGSAGKRVYVADSTTNVGSIGVVATHTDVSKAQAAQGVKTTEIYAGAYKRIDSSYEPLTKAGRQCIQDRVDYTYGLFVDAVAKNRGVSADVVLSNMAEGRIFMGQQAVDAGLVDGITTLDALIAQLNAERTQASASQVASKPASPSYGASKASNPAPAKPTTGARVMTPEELQAQHPAAAAHFLEQGATAERARIAGIEAQAIPGHDKLIASMKADGSKSPADAAMAIVAAEKAQRIAQATAAANEAPAPLPAVVPPGAAADAPKAALGKNGMLTGAVDMSALDAAAKQYQANHPGTSYVNAVKAVQHQGA